MQTNSLVISQSYENYVSSVSSQSEDLLKNVFPRKIEELNKLLDSTEFSLKDQLTRLHESANISVSALDQPSLNKGSGDSEEEASKKRKLDKENGGGDAAAVVATGGAKEVLARSVSCNSVISERIGVIKPFIRELVEHSNLLKMWVILLIPKIEDGNNFGVSIQEETLAEIRAVEAEAALLQELITQYYVNRAKIISKVAKYPNIDDYKRTVKELDEKEFVKLRNNLQEIRNHYASMYGLIFKNWEKINKPRTSNVNCMY